METFTRTSPRSHRRKTGHQELTQEEPVFTPKDPKARAAILARRSKDSRRSGTDRLTWLMRMSIMKMIMKSSQNLRRVSMMMMMKLMKKVIKVMDTSHKMMLNQMA